MFKKQWIQTSTSTSNTRAWTKHTNKTRNTTRHHSTKKSKEKVRKIAEMEAKERKERSEPAFCFFQAAKSSRASATRQARHHSWTRYGQEHFQRESLEPRWECVDRIVQTFKKYNFFIFFPYYEWRMLPKKISNLEKQVPYYLKSRSGRRRHASEFIFGRHLQHFAKKLVSKNVSDHFSIKMASLRNMDIESWFF